MPTTIARSHTRRIAEIRERAVRCRVYSSANDFTGTDRPPENAWADWERHPAALLREHDDGHWSIDIDDNHWWELYPADTTTPAETPAAAAPEGGVVSRIDSPRIAEAKRRAVHARLYARDTNFLGVACSLADAWAEYERTPWARLRVLDEGDSWSIHISDDRWYGLYPVEMPLLDQPGRPPEPGPEIDPDILEAVLTEMLGRDGAETVFTELDAAMARAKLDDPLECVCGEREEPDVMTCGTCGRSWCNRCHPTPSARCPSEYDHPDPEVPRLRWEAGPDSGVIGVTEAETVTLVLDGGPLLGLDLKTGTVTTWPDGETPKVLARFQQRTLHGFGVKTEKLPRLAVVTSDAEVIPLRPPTT